MPVWWCVFSDRTVILKPPEDLLILRGTSVLLPCKFSTDPRLPKAQVVWKKDGIKLMESEATNK